MRVSSLVVALGALCAIAGAVPRPNYVVHERRSQNIHKEGWKRSAPLHSSQVFPMRIGLKQRNLEHAESLIMDVSDPASPNYGNHWTPEEVIDYFKPSEESVKAVAMWLHSSGIDMERHQMSHGLNWIEFDITAQEAKNLLLADYHYFMHDSKVGHVACDHYSIPQHLQDHIDFVSPGVHFDTQIPHWKDDTLEKRHESAKEESTFAIDEARLHRVPHSELMPTAKVNKSDLAQCGFYNVVPDCLRYLYGFTNPSTIHSGNSYGIVEYTPNEYIPSDLDLFFSNFSPSQVGQRPNFNSIDGGLISNTQNLNNNGESDLDLEWSMVFVYPQSVTLYQAGDPYIGASFNTFLDAIDGSYCTYMGGDNSSHDPMYPDPYNYTNAYKGNTMCGTYAPTKVISTSYAYNEHSLPANYEMRQCNEYMKLGLMGTTVFYSSGDYGVAGNRNTCIADNGTYIYGATSGRFNPSFPAGCPWITSVGATEIIYGTDVTKTKSKTQVEQACSTIIYSGGGFSNVFPMPSYQSSAVAHYTENYPPPYTSSQYNNSGTVRAFPDISSNGAWWLVAVDGNYDYRWFGTSLSSPTWGSIITLINNQRLKKGKSTVGFINPMLYSNVAALKDVTQGNNPGCGTTGFSAVPGWDPLTGLGTPIYSKLLSVFMSMP